ncbi:MAG TPA: ATP-dependent sacrificial sulfur transferase LarE [Acidimicrobiales bacterium]|nr:ATP-dependent sacrificial sulfur transferase LarE [Acidimicrobiales bacterium]
MSADLLPAFRRLADALAAIGPLVVGFSGGADSALLGYVATEILGQGRVLCVTAVSPSLAPEELEDCRALATEWSLCWQTVETHELANAAYAANGGDRCYHCKVELMSLLGPIAAGRGATVALGVNLDDLGEHRPGQQAAAERGAVFPFVTASMGKGDVRELSRALGLRTADKPAAACLASRVPYGTPVTLGILNEVATAESGLKRLGLAAVRVRHYGDLARVEVPIEDLPRLMDQREEVVAAVRSAGYRYVTLDLEGLRSGNLNQALTG